MLYPLAVAADPFIQSATASTDRKRQHARTMNTAAKETANAATQRSACLRQIKRRLPKHSASVPRTAVSEVNFTRAFTARSAPASKEKASAVRGDSFSFERKTGSAAERHARTTSRHSRFI